MVDFSSWTRWFVWPLCYTVAFVAMFYLVAHLLTLFLKILQLLSFYTWIRISVFLVSIWNDHIKEENPNSTRFYSMAKDVFANYETKYPLQDSFKYRVSITPRDINYKARHSKLPRYMDLQTLVFILWSSFMFIPNSEEVICVFFILVSVHQICSEDFNFFQIEISLNGKSVL